MTSNSDRTSWNRKGSDKQTAVCRVVLVIRCTLFICRWPEGHCGLQWSDYVLWVRGSALARCWVWIHRPAGAFLSILFLCFSPQSTDMHVRLTSDSKLCSGVNVALQPGSLSSTYPDFHPIMAGLGHSWYFRVMQMSRVALETLNLLCFCSYESRVTTSSSMNGKPPSVSQCEDSRGTERWVIALK